MQTLRGEYGPRAEGPAWILLRPSRLHVDSALAQFALFFKLSNPSAPISSLQRAANRQMSQCLALAVLLHIWLVLMFGNATGTAPPGEGVWGRLNVTLVGAKSEPGSGMPQPLSAAPVGPVGRAKQERFGGTVRPIEDAQSKAKLPSTPGAAELGAWNDKRVEASQATQAPREARPAPSATQDPASGKTTPPLVAPALTEAAAPPAPLVPIAPAAPTAPDGTTTPTPALMMAAPAALTPARLAPVTGLSLSPNLAPSPFDPSPLPNAKVRVMEATAAAAALPRSKADAIGRAAELPGKPRQQPLALPVLPQFKAAAVPAVKPQSLAPIVAEPIEPMRQAQAVTAPVMAAPSPPAEPVAAPVTLATPLPEPAKHLAAPVELARQPRNELQSLPASPTAAPVAALAASAVPLPVAATPLAATSTAVTPTAVTPTAVTPTAAPAPRASQNPAAAPVAATSASESRAALSSGAAPSTAASLVPAVPQPGAPEAGARLGVDVATPASTPPNAARLNLNLPRPQGGELARRGSSGVLQLMPAPPELKSKLSQDMEKAARDDCRKAYGESLGLLAVVPLALDAARSNNKGCRW